MKKKLAAVLINLGTGLVGALWIWIALLEMPGRPAFMVFGLVAVSLSLANLAMLGEWSLKHGSG